MSSSPDSDEGVSNAHFSPWVMASVITTCAVIIIFSCLRAVMQVCCPPQRITFSRNQVQRRQLLDESTTDDPSLQFHSQGLDFLTIHSLPVTQFKEVSEGETNENETSPDCVVCLGEFKEGEWIRHLPSCTHFFHISCIDTWFLNHSNCPLCRSEVQSLKFEDLESTVLSYSPVQTLQREDFFRERAAHYQILRSEILQNSVGRNNRSE